VGVNKRKYTAGQWDPGARGRGLAYDAEIMRRMSGGKSPKSKVVVTGFDEIDQAFAEFDEKLKKKFIRQALREAVKKEVLPEYQRIIQQEGLIETGALHDVPKVGTAKVKRGSGKIGNSLFIDRKLLTAVRSAKGGRLGYDSKRKEPFYYLAAFEYGTQWIKAFAPLRRALANAKQAVIDRCKRALMAAADSVAIGKKRKRVKGFDKTINQAIKSAAGE
jgi:hypothetical protein